MKPRSHLAEYIFRLFTIEINSANANNRNDKNTICDYPNIYECVSDYMKIHHDWLSPSITGMETSWRPVSDSSLRGSRSLEIWRVARESRWNQTSSILRLFGDFFKSPVGLGDVAATSQRLNIFSKRKTSPRRLRDVSETCPTPNDWGKVATTSLRRLRNVAATSPRLGGDVSATTIDLLL